MNFEAADGCDDHGHDHGHAPAASDTPQVCGQHCDCVPQNFDLWRCDRTNEFGANEFAVSVIAMESLPGRVTVSDQNPSRWIIKPHGGESLPLEVRAVRQVFQL